jgi:hypothetical protein
MKRPRFSQDELEALDSALAFILAGDVEEADPDITREIFESAQRKVWDIKASGRKG